VTVVQRETRLMERQLDTPAARTLEKALDALGIEVHSGVTVDEVHGDDAVTGITLSDGSTHPADLIVLCCGVRPRVDLAEQAGLKVNFGVVVDDELRSVSDESIFAIGECAEHDGRLYGLVAPAWEQASVAAIALTEGGARYRGSVQVTRLKAAGIELAAMGDTSALDEDELCDDTELVTFADRRRGVYLKLLVRDDAVRGAILLGDTRNAATITQLFERATPVPADRSSLLMVRRNAPTTTAASPTALPGAATICQCNGVTKAAITSAWQNGAHTVGEIAARTRATTGCGTCKDTVCGLVDWLARADGA
jgi:assimilatory nitrate reductase electron transfer subunit